MCVREKVTERARDRIVNYLVKKLKQDMSSEMGKT
jgi:hypothetical protein